MKDKKNQNLEETEMNNVTETQSDVETNEFDKSPNVENPENNNENLNKEIEELKDKYLRLYSEFDNFRRRTTKERIDLINNAGQDILKSLLPVIDDMERAEKSIKESTEAKVAADGIKIILNKFKNILEQQGLKEYNSIGENFNDELHEAITKIPAKGKEQKGKIVDEIEKGYKLRDKVIRFAKVIVGE